jgi:CheY-like chemotaxis protein
MADPKSSCDILVVDDDTDIRVMLTMVLDEEGYVVATALNGYDALAQLDAGLRPRLILLDWWMPVMGGEQFRQAQRQRRELSGIPVVVISAHATLSLGEAVDATILLPKPINFEQLFGIVAQYCSV